MFFMPRVTGPIALVLLAAVILLFALDADEIAGILAGGLFVFLLLGVVFDLWERPHK